MKTEVGKAIGSIVRKTPSAPPGPSSRQKATKPAGKVSAKKTSKKSTVAVKRKVLATKRKKRAVKRKGFVAKKTPTIYDIHPMRKLFELMLYERYSGRSLDFVATVGINELDSVKTSKTELQKRVKTKKEIFAVKREMSQTIMMDYHPDQKILMWDYLKNGTFPSTIDLKYHFIPVEVSNMLKTFQQRRVIEGYTMLGYPPKEIANVVNRNPELAPVTGDMVEVYQYFFWNLDASNIMAIYPVQVLANYILQIRGETLQNYREIIKAHKKAGTLTDDLKNALTRTVMISTPYYQSDNVDVYTKWSSIVFEANKNTLDTYKPIVAVSNGDISPAKLNAMVQVADYSVLTYDQQMQELSQGLLNAAEAAMEDSITKAMGIIKNGILPLSQTMLLQNIPKKDAGSNLGNTTKVYISKARTLQAGKGKAIIIDPYEDRQKRQKEMLEKATDAEFSEVPIDSEIGQS